MPTDIYNFDELGFRVGIGKDQWIITREPYRKAYISTDTNRELVTMMETISGDGVDLLPMIILAGAQFLHQWFKNSALPNHYLLGLLETGYSNDELAFDWLKHFDAYSSRCQLGAYRLLIFDGHGSHLTKEFIEYCDNRKIIPFTLPPHTSHLLQPLDVVVF